MNNADAFVEVLDIILLSSVLKIIEKNEILNYIFEKIHFQKFSDEKSLICFVTKYFDDSYLVCNRQFYDFIILQTDYFGYSDGTLLNLAGFILEFASLRNEWINYFTESCTYNFLFACILVEKMLNSENHNVEKKVIEKILMNLKSNLSIVVEILLSKSLILCLEEYITLKVKNKRNCIQTSSDLRAIVTAFDRIPDIAYLSYYLLDSADLSKSKKEVLEMNICDTFKNIFDNNIDFRVSRNIDRILSYFYNFPHFAFFLNHFLFYAYNHNIQPENILNKIGFKRRICHLLSNRLMLKLIQRHILGTHSKQFDNYVKLVFSNVKEELLDFLKTNNFTDDPIIHDKICKFLGDKKSIRKKIGLFKWAQN